MSSEDAVMRATADDDQRFRLIATSHIIPIDDDQAFRRIATTGSARALPVVGDDGRRWVIRESAWLRLSIRSGECLNRDYPCEVLRLSAAGLSKRKIATSLGMSATAARDCIWIRLRQSKEESRAGKKRLRSWRRGRTKEWHQTGEQNAPRPDTLIPSPQPSTKPGQVHSPPSASARVRANGALSNKTALAVMFKVAAKRRNSSPV
jgi:hypothetical protein